MRTMAQLVTSFYETILYLDVNPINQVDDIDPSGLTNYKREISHFIINVWMCSFSMI